MIEENLLDLRARGVSDGDAMRKHARLRYNIQLRQGGLGLFSPESFGNAAFIGGMLASEDAIRRHFSGHSPEEPPASPISSCEDEAA